MNGGMNSAATNGAVVRRGHVTGHTVNGRSDVNGTAPNRNGDLGSTVVNGHGAHGMSTSLSSGSSSPPASPSGIVDDVGDVADGVQRMAVAGRQKMNDPLFQTARGRLQKKRAVINDKISREIRLRSGAENLLRVTRDKRVRDQVCLELSYANSHLQLLKDELQEVNSSVEVYQAPAESLLPVVALGLKETKPVDYTQAIGDYVEEHYSELRADYTKQIDALNSLRMRVTTPSRNLEGLSLLMQYFNQLYFLDRRFFSPQRNLGVYFHWFDSFTGVPFTQKSLVFEKASILFNMAALYSQLAADKDRTRLEGLAHSQELFCRAAGVLRYLADHFEYAPGMDMKQPLLEMMISLFCAQAEECHFLSLLMQRGKEKADLNSQSAQQASGDPADIVNNNFSAEDWEAGLRLAKLSQWVSLSYDKVHTYLAGEVLRYVDYIPESWLSLVQIKTSYFAAIAHHFVCRLLKQWAESLEGSFLDLMLVLKSLYKAQTFRKPVDSVELMTLSRAHAKEALNHLEEAVRAMSLCRRLSELDDCSRILRKAHNGALQLLSQLGEDGIFSAAVPVQTIRGETDWVATGLAPEFGSHLVEDLFKQLGPLNFFEARRSWSHPRELFIGRLASENGGGFGFSIRGEFPVSVAAVDRGCPADEAGMRAGDVMVRVENEDTKWASHERLIELVRSAGECLHVWLVTPRALDGMENVDGVNAAYRLAQNPSNSVPVKQRKGGSKWKKRLSGSWLFKRRGGASKYDLDPQL